MKKIPEPKWKDAMDKILRSQSEEDMMFTPSRAQVRYLVSASNRLNEASHEIRTVSRLAHDQLIDKKEAQRILSYQSKQIKRTLREIERFLEPIEIDEE